MSHYDRDFYLWTQEQAALLRKGMPGSNALDRENLATEIEDLGKSDYRAMRSTTIRVLEHLFKLLHSPAKPPRNANLSRNSWLRSVYAHRGELLAILKDSPSLKRRLAEDWAGFMQDARIEAELGLAEDGIEQAHLPPLLLDADQLVATDFSPQTWLDQQKNEDSV